MQCRASKALLFALLVTFCGGGFACGSGAIVPNRAPGETEVPNGGNPAKGGDGGRAWDGGSQAGAGGDAAELNTISGGRASSGGRGGTSAGTGGRDAGGSAATADAGMRPVMENPPPKQVLPCDALTSIGVWEKITPPGKGGFTSDFVLDPVHAGVVYVGGNGGFGIWKSTDCGSTWTQANTGKNADLVTAAAHWTIAIDHIDPNVLYTGNGYGAGGVFKSSNAGADWDQVLPADAINVFELGGFVERITVSPTDHNHVLASPHFLCEGGHSQHCMLESKDAGKTWRVLENQPASGEDSGQVMINSSLWFYGNPWTDGLWRTTDGGKTWANVRGYGTTSSIYVQKDGVMVVSSLTEGILRSTDQGQTWNALANSPNARALTGNGVTLFASKRNEDTPYYPYWQAPEKEPTKWSQYPSPALPRGGWVVHYDEQHDILYSSTETNGFWRVKVK